MQMVEVSKTDLESSGKGGGRTIKKNIKQQQQQQQ